MAKMPSTNCNIENEYWKIVHVPDEPPIPPHLQPTVNAHASVINPKHANTLIRKLNKISPLEDLRHVKRIRKRCVEGNVQLLMILCSHDSGQLEAMPGDIAELIDSYQLSTFITKVSKYPATSKVEWEEQCKLWPTSYHPPTYNIDGITGFSEESLLSVLEFMKFAVDLAKSVDGQQFWTLKLPTDSSWIRKKLLRLRATALQFISYQVANGDGISLWFDPWWRNSCLASSESSPIITQCGSNNNKNAKLSSIITSVSWRLPIINSRHHHLDPLLIHWISSFDFPAINSGSHDLILWDGNDASKIKTWHIWDSIRHRAPAVGWYLAVWHKLRINRHAHHQWLTCHGRLNTLARLHSSWILRHLFSSLNITVRSGSWSQFLSSLMAIEDKVERVVALCFAQIVNAAVIVNPTSNQVVARSCDQVFSQKNTSTRKNIGAGYLEPCETTSSPSIISGLQTHTSSTSNSSFNKQKMPYSDVSCLHPWQWTEQQSQASCFRHPLHHAAMVAIENYASRDRYLFPASKDVGDKWCQADFGDSPLTIVPTKRQTTNTYVEDSGIENGETARPYLCTGYDIYLVWEPCIMCAMALVHQRIKRIFYAFPNPYAGALESLHRLQGEKSLNHHYAVFRVFLPESILDRGDIIATTSRINQNKIQV
ncbi:hypothetical protein AgCh_022402 [Apium graveolens]